MRWVVLLAVVAIVLSGCGDSGNSQEAIRAKMNSPEFKARLEQAEREKKVIEKAPWMGKTGLSAETEREMPRFVRHQLGQIIFDKGALKASDLDYLGAYLEEGNTVHYWRMKTGEYVFVSVSGAGDVLMGMGYKEPSGPRKQSKP